MELIKGALDFILHLDKNLTLIIQQFGIFSYLILFLIIFLETGAVIVPFLPGDSLLFVAGTFAGRGTLNIWGLYFSLLAAAIIGDTVNYWIGHYLGPKVFKKENTRFFNPDNLEKTRKFFDKYGGKTIILARFLPIIRTFAPFVAGVGSMHYGQFFAYNVIGGFIWVTSLLFAGYFFGSLPIIRDNFETAIFVIIFISIIPALIEVVKHKLEARKRHKTESTTLKEVEHTFEKKHIAD